MLRDIYLLVENDNNERNKIGSFYDYVMMSPFCISLVVLPAGIITAGYMNEIRK